MPNSEHTDHNNPEQISKIPTFVNPCRFIKAVEYASANYFSKPYSLTSIVDRWFNQLAMVEMSDGSIVHLTAQVAQQYVDIVLDGQVVSKSDIQLVMGFFSKHGEADKEGKTLEDKIELAQGLLETTNNNEKKKKNDLISKLATLRKSLAKFDAKKLKASVLYNNIVSRGQSSLNIRRLEEKYGSTVKNIVYRPNHGLTHSTRAAYYVSAIQAYRETHHIASPLLDNEYIENLQLMMLFSVVGRQDETGFHDSGALGNTTYQSFRTASGRAYLNYSQMETPPRYTSLEDMYRDAIVVELMGYESIEKAISRGMKKPALLVDYVIEKEKLAGRTISRTEAVTLIDQEKYTLNALYPDSERKLANANLLMMNEAHAIDLMRCYPLYPNIKNGPKMINLFSHHLAQAKVLDFNDEPDLDAFTSFFQFMRCSFDTLEATGQSTTFGMLSEETFKEKQDAIMLGIKQISDDCKHPDNKEASLCAAKALLAVNGEPAPDNTINYFDSKAKNDTNLLNDYRNYLITRYIATQLCVGKKLDPDKRMFDFNHLIAGNQTQIDHHANAAGIVHALQTMTQFPGVAPIERPLISAIEDKPKENQVSLFFENNEQALNFQMTYQTMFQQTTAIMENDSGQFVIDVNRKNYQQLVQDRLLEFKLVTIPKTVEREDTLVDADGNIGALNKIKHSRGLVRFVSTSDLNGAGHPDCNYLFNEMEDPIHNRYPTPIKDKGASWKADRARYQDPRTGKYYMRRVLNSRPIDPNLQEPITKPRSSAKEVPSDWVINAQRGAPKNTIIPKGRANSLIRHDGRLTPFAGYLSKAHNYFPIGVLSDIEQVELKGGRYVWSKNMVSHTKFWLRDTRHMDTLLLDAMNVIRDHQGNLERDDEGAIKCETIRNVFDNNYVKDIKRRAAKITKLLDNQFYRPSDAILKDLTDMITREKTQYTTNCPTFNQKPEILATYETLLERIEQESERKSNKYALSPRELIKQQRTSFDETSDHNEIIAGVPKIAVQAFCAGKDQLFDRLNLAFHAMQIKKDYGYDVPLLVMSPDKPPYHYTEVMIKADILAAYAHIRAETFPYDTSVYPVYQLDKNGEVIQDEEGNPIVQKKKGVPIYISKNIEYQKKLLLDLFKIGLPELSCMDELVTGTVNGVAIDAEATTEAITTQMAVIGGLKRETARMMRLFNPTISISPEIIKQREDFFLRSAALGHQSLIENAGIQLTEPLLKKAIQLAQQNQHSDVADTLIGWHGHVKRTKSELFVELARYKTDAPKLDNNQRNKRLSEIISQYEVLNQVIAVPKVTEKIKSILTDQWQAYFSELKNACHNLQDHDEFIQFEAETLPIISQISTSDRFSIVMHDLEKARETWLAENNNIEEQKNKIQSCLDAFEHLTLEDPNDIQNRLNELDIRFHDLSETKLSDHLKEPIQQKINTLKERLLKETRKNCLEYIQLIKEQAMGDIDLDSTTRDFCEHMQAEIMAQDTYMSLHDTLKQLTLAYAAVTSQEMMAVRTAIERLQEKAKNPIGIGYQRKANKVISAICNVPLLDRLHVFSNEENPACNQVRIALAKHRKNPFAQRAHQSQVNLEKAAKSFNLVKNALKALKNDDTTSSEEISPKK